MSPNRAPGPSQTGSAASLGPRSEQSSISEARVRAKRSVGALEDRICFDNLEGPPSAADGDSEAADSVSMCARSERSELSGLSVATPAAETDRDGTDFLVFGMSSADGRTPGDPARVDDSSASGTGPGPGL